MSVLSFFRRLAGSLGRTAETSAQIRDGIANQSALLNDRLGAIIAGFENQQNITGQSKELLSAIHQGINNQSTLLNDKLGEIIAGLVNEQTILNDKLSKIIEELDSKNEQYVALSRLVENLNKLLGPGLSPITQRVRAIHKPAPDDPDQGSALVRNFPGTLRNGDKPSGNPALRAVRQLMQSEEHTERAWSNQLEMALAELRAIPGADELFARKATVDEREPSRADLDGALFLYWIVRRLRPRTVVEAGVAAGFWTGIMLLALAKNANEAKLYAVGGAETFASVGPSAIAKADAFGEIVAENRPIGWMVPNEFREKWELYSGSLEVFLPKIVEERKSVDLFIYDSNPFYERMLLEFCEVQPVLSQFGTIMTGNVAWNPSLWDFAKYFNVPAYNFRGIVGAAFF